MSAPLATPRSVLRNVFGYSRFHPLQKEVITHVLKGEDALVLMPTGGGKSICFQVPALCVPGVTLVISPLVSLMKDQVEMLQANGVAAAYWNSTLSPEENRTVYRDMMQGAIKLLYISPERLFGDSASTWLSELQVSLVAIDEAHCISFWGHDFRREYTRLGELRTLLPNVPIIALTATADPIIRRDILQQLAIPETSVFQSSFDRPNLYLEVQPGQKRLERILAFLAAHPREGGIIYCATRATTEQVAEKLRQRKYSAEAYHAGMPADQRERVQDAFQRDTVQIVVATIAFGMGIDKSNVRWVIHYNLPRTMEGYYQEIGRAGRDGLPADTLLLYSYADVAQSLRFMGDVSPDRRALLEAKLERMKQYAETRHCRRRVLLAYFGEEVSEGCGNCDACRNPPVYVDGTITAQKLLSAVYRTGQRCTLRQGVGILRGSYSREITAPRWDQLPTFGVGTEHSFVQWMEYGAQIINQGYLSVAYDRGMALTITPTGKDVLAGKAVVQLVHVDPERPYERERAASASVSGAATGPSSQESAADAELFDKLRELRSTLAKEKNVPAFVIFSDRSLRDMAARKPVSLALFETVHGVGTKKADTYGPRFIALIAAWKKQ